MQWYVGIGGEVTDVVDWYWCNVTVVIDWAGSRVMVTTEIGKG